MSEHLLRDDLDFAIAKNTSRWTAQRSKRVHLLLRFVLLDKSDRDIEYDNGSENAAFNPVFDRKRDDGRKNQYCILC